MNNTINPEKLKKAPLASKCFMGLGQILYLKQYIRGSLFALVEIIMICCVVFGTKKIIPANKSVDDVMQGLPDTVEMIEYLQDNDYKNVDNLVAARTSAMKSFVEKTALKNIKSSFKEASEKLKKAENSQKKKPRLSLTRLRQKETSTRLRLLRASLTKPIRNLPRRRMP